LILGRTNKRIAFRRLYTFRALKLDHISDTSWILKRKVAACGGIDKLERQDLTMFDLIYFNPSEPGKE
jgi:hypothetical protein